MRIGTDDSFHHVAMRWGGDTLHITRRGEYVTVVEGVVRIDEERRRAEESEQDILFLRLTTRCGLRAFFIDSDPVQTNVREVAPELERLDEVFPWLLPTGYTHRQGDVGIYRSAVLPPTALRIPREEYADHFVDILSKRHALDPMSACEFYIGDNHYYVSVNGPARLMHPEHPAIPLEVGLYQLIGARGTPLPVFVGLREGETPELRGEVG